MPLTYKKIGFIGLGLMGAPMAKNLLEANADLTVYNRTSSKCAGLANLGAKVAVTPAQVAHDVGTGTIILCVSDTPSLEAALDGDSGVLAGLVPGAVVIDMGTSEVSATRRLAVEVKMRGGRYIDAPVSGGEVGAKAGTLSIMAGGDPTDINATKPVFDVLGGALTHIGPVGTGQAAKVANQAIVGTTVGIIAESLALAAAAGADIAKVREALMGGFAGSRILELHGQRMIDGAFSPGARATTQHKDMRHAVDLAREVELSLPLLSKSQWLWAAMVESGMGELDQSGYFAFVRETNKSRS
ncbi:NAD(P)-dependent oxidoreductase [Loktanella sp. Alg231-35]|uniref:NAD(P)-dependent oxidoreductase n=1 Tax=Loktanella sp. Alg231-35 TaxID=1922220 RepID=UPI002277CE5E|nr:NAD(P)-dependent oxidoreductase [Loktanella sp. Alg231-35]